MTVEMFMKIRLAKDADSKSWDRCLDKFPSQPPLNRYGWKAILEDSYRVKAPFFIASDQKGEACGILPTYITKDLKGKRRLYSLRFGLIADNRAILNELVSKVKNYCEENKIASNLVTSGYQRIDSGFRSIAKKTLIMELSKDEESTWRSLRDKTRNMIRKAIKSNLIAERGFHHLKEFYDIYTINMLEKGIPIHSYRFFVNISKRLKENAELIIARKNHKIVAGTLVFFSKDIAIYPFQASLPDALKFAPNDFLIWESIKSCLQRRVFRLDMGESKEGGSVYRFKANFGGRPQDVYYYTTDAEAQPSYPGRSSIISKPTFSFNRGISSPLLLYLRKKILLWMKVKGRII